MRHLCHGLRADAAALVADEEDFVSGQWAVGSGQWLTLQGGAVDGHAAGGEPGGEVDIVDLCAQHGAHGGLHDLGVVAGDGVAAADHAADAEPVGRAQHGAQVAGVLDVVQRQDKWVAGSG